MSMTNLSELTPHILDQTRVGRWEARARLLGIVAARTWDGESWTQLGINELMRYGRTRKEAVYDRRLLQRMAERDRILVRHSMRGGRYPDLWRIAGDDVEDLAQWRHVPWLTSGSAAIRSLRAYEASLRSVRGLKDAGQGSVRGDLGPGFQGSGDHDPRSEVGNREPKVGNREPNLPGETASDRSPRTEPGTEPAAEATPLAFKSLLSDNHSLTHSSEESGEGVRERSSPQEVRKLVWEAKEHLDEALTVKATELHLPPVAVEVGSSMWTRLWDLVERYAGDPVILLARCDSFTGRMFSLQRALDELEMWVAAGPPSAAPGPAPRRELWRVSVEWTEPDGLRRRSRSAAKMFETEAEAEAWATAVAAGDVTLHEDQGNVEVLDVEAVR